MPEPAPVTSATLFSKDMFIFNSFFNIARPNFLDWTALALRPAATGGDKQGLTERMCVPRGASTRLERHARGGRAFSVSDSFFLICGISIPL